MNSENKQRSQTIQLPDHWHRGYSSRKQQTKFEGRKPRKAVGKRRRKAA